jgi:hypothetical protein
VRLLLRRPSNLQIIDTMIPCLLVFWITMDLSWYYSYLEACKLVHAKPFGLKIQIKQLITVFDALICVAHVKFLWNCYLPFKIRRTGYFYHNLSDSLTDDMRPIYECRFWDCGEFGMSLRLIRQGRSIYKFTNKNSTAHHISKIYKFWVGRR